jgi:phosphate transport system permease protein
MAVTRSSPPPMPPTVPTVSGAQPGDQVFLWVVRIASVVAILLLVSLVLVLVTRSTESLHKFGPAFLTELDWDPPNEVFGAFAFIYGTIVTALIALLLATPFSLGAALFVSEYAPRWLGTPIAFVVELLVTIPSVVYGLWGVFVLAPLMRKTIEPFLKSSLGSLPVFNVLFKGAPYGKDVLTAGVILAIMITPTILSISREIITQVPRLQKEGVLALGATKWETIRFAILPYARGGIVGAMMLGLARAVGETMAVTMVIGNSAGQIKPSLLSPGATIASTIANQFGDTTSRLHESALIELGLVLLVVASLFNIAARLIVRLSTRVSTT